MPVNYAEIKQYCKRSQELTRSVIDEFLLYYAADAYNLDRDINKQFSRFRHVTRESPEEWVNMMKAQYIVHRIFKEDGLIQRLINHRTLASHLGEEEMEFLRFNRDHRWRFSYSMIVDNPTKDFFEMLDVFTDDTFLLYSPGTAQVLKGQEPLLWFNLINFNGKCWETYGTIGHFKSFEPEDILFFASQLYPNKWFENAGKLLAVVEEKPVPFMFLFLVSNQPLVFNGVDQIVHVTGEFLDDTFDSTSLQNTFTIEYDSGVYRLSLENWSSFPHFSLAYYDEREKLLFVSAMSDRGYEALIDALNDCGYALPYDPDFRVNMGMMAAAQDILNKTIRLNPYDALFDGIDMDEFEDYEKPGQLENLDQLMTAIIPDINAGKKPDSAKLARQFNVDIETAKELIDKLWDKYGSA